MRFANSPARRGHNGTLKFLISAVLVLLILITCMPFATVRSEYTDIYGHWA
jgi:hypothetical protein